MNQTRGSYSIQSPAHIELDIGTNWSEMERVNERVFDFLSGLGLQEDSVDTLTMVVCELTENAIKYSRRPGSEEERISLSATVEQKSMSVQVVNHISPDKRHHLRQLDKTLQWTRGFQDPFQAYLERIKEISREQLYSEKSGLGIVRIAYEARAAIDFILGEDDTLSVSAVMEFI